MPRAPYQVLVLPFRKSVGNSYEHAVFRRSDNGLWQSVAGGGEINESTDDTARRETNEETGIDLTANFYRLNTTTTVPANLFKDRKHWPKDLYVIPSYCFAVDATGFNIILSDEHTDCVWTDYENASRMLYWPNNKTAIWELQERLQNNDLIPLTNHSISGSL